jgi:hypothetical protein
MHGGFFTSGERQLVLQNIESKCSVLADHDILGS